MAEVAFGSLLGANPESGTSAVRAGWEALLGAGTDTNGDALSVALGARLPVSLRLGNGPTTFVPYVAPGGFATGSVLLPAMFVGTIQGGVRVGFLDRWSVDAAVQRVMYSGSRTSVAGVGAAIATR